MNSKSSYYVKLLFTITVVILLWIITVNLGAVLLVSITFLVWVIAEKKAIKKDDEYYLLIDRVGKLKTLSYELQKLIDNELSLVKEDVLRTRNIVSDSVDILQAASLSIHATVVLQDSEVRNFSATDAQVVRKIQKTREIIVPQAEAAFSNSKNTDYFVENNTLIKRNSEKIMQALQFEDIVNQVSERVVQHIGDIQLIVNMLSNACDNDFSSTFDQEVEKMNEEYCLIKKRLSDMSAKKIVAQEDMSEGDIDIF